MRKQRRKEVRRGRSNRTGKEKMWREKEGGDGGIRVRRREERSVESGGGG